MGAFSFTSPAKSKATKAFAENYRLFKLPESAIISAVLASKLEDYSFLSPAIKQAFNNKTQINFDLGNTTIPLTTLTAAHAVKAFLSFAKESKEINTLKITIPQDLTETGKHKPVDIISDALTDFLNHLPADLTAVELTFASDNKTSLSDEAINAMIRITSASNNKVTIKLNNLPFSPAQEKRVPVDNKEKGEKTSLLSHSSSRLVRTGHGSGSNLMETASALSCN